MEQLKPIPHPLMALPIDEAQARAFFKDEAQVFEIRRRLTKGQPSLRPSDVSTALEKIAIACHRYSTARTYHQSPEPVDGEWYGNVQNAVADFRTLFEDGNAPTVNRLLIAIGEEAEYNPDAPSTSPDSAIDEHLDARLSRLSERGLSILNQQLKLLHWWEAAAERAADGASTKTGRPPIRTPLLERSLVHELVDIWCSFHNEPYVAPKTFLKPTLDHARPNQSGALFLATVLAQARFDFSELDMVRIGELVRIERNNEWNSREADPDYSRNRAIREKNSHIPKVTLRRRGFGRAVGDEE